MIELSKKPETILKIFELWLVTSEKTFFQILPFTLLFVFINMVKALFASFINESDPKIIHLSFYLVSGILGVFAFACMGYKVFSLLVEKKELPFKAIISSGLRRIIPIILTNLLVILVLLPIAIVFLPPLFSTGEPSKASAILTLLSMLIYSFAILYAFYLVVKLCLVLILACIPGKGAWESIADSANLVKGNFWRVFILFFTSILIFAAIAILIPILLPAEEPRVREGFFAIFILPFLQQIWLVFDVVLLNDLQKRKELKPEVMTS